MPRRWGPIALLACAGLLAAAGAAEARVDSIEVNATTGTNGPPGVDLSAGVTLAHRAFVGTVLTEGSLATCASDYAAALGAPRSVKVEGSFEELPEGAGSEITGAQVLLPRGIWSLCGWVQPGGEAAGVPPSAAAGPVVFSVGGPEGTTRIQSPPVLGQEQPLPIQVSYALAQAGGRFPGFPQAALQTEVTGAGEPCPGGSAVRLDAAGPLVQSAALTSPASGTASFTGHLAPGSYGLCAWLDQTYPTAMYGLLPNLNPPAFGASTQPLTVLPRPAVSGLAARLTGGRHRRRSVIAYYTLNEPGTATLTLEQIVPTRRRSTGTICLRNPANGRRFCGVGRTVASGQINAAAGPNSVRLPAGRGSGLRAGVYLLTASAESAAHEVSPAAGFTFAVRR